MINLSLSPTKSFSYTIIWVLFLIPSCVLSVDESHILCTPYFRCGKYTDLSYPFWTPEREKCGHPDFKVNCNEDFAEFNISSAKFRILEMNYRSRIIRLARMDYFNDLCPQHPENITIDQHVLSFPRDTELRTFYYDCPGLRVTHLPKGYSQLECEDGVQSYFVSSPSHTRNRDFLNALSASCERVVNTPVSRSALRRAEKIQSLEAIKQALDEGFKLSFNRACSRCIASGGACGFNQSSNAFVCYCVDEPHEYTCHPEKKGNDLSFSFSLNISAGLS